MKIIIPKKVSKKVASFGEIKSMAVDLQVFLEKDNFHLGKIKKNTVAIHHSQVDPEPFNFFVIKRDVVRAKPNEIVVIVNPEIIEKDSDTRITTSEGCVSFQFRPDVKVKRYDRIKVRYQIPDEKEELFTKEEWIEGMMAYVFQHEVQHAKGNHIYK